MQTKQQKHEISGSKNIYSQWHMHYKGQSSWWQSITHGWFPIWLPSTHSLYLSLFLQYLTCNCDNLEVGQFKVIQDQSTQSQPKAHWWFPIWPFLESNTVSVFIFEKFDEKVLWRKSRTVQGHPRSKVMVPTGCVLAFSYLTFVSEMTYYVSSGTLNSTHSLTHSYLTSIVSNGLFTPPTREFCIVSTQFRWVLPCPRR